MSVQRLEKKEINLSNQRIHLKKKKKSPLQTFLRYCFGSHITFPLVSLGVLERKLKELQQTVILHLLPGCSAPASCSPKGCMGRLGSQAQRSPGRKSVQSQHKTLHAVVSSILPQHSSSRQQRSSSAAVCHNLDRTQQFCRNPVFKILFQGESRSVFCAAWSCDVCPRKYQAGAQPTVPETVWKQF